MNSSNNSNNNNVTSAGNSIGNGGDSTEMPNTWSGVQKKVGDIIGLKPLFFPVPFSHRFTVS
jgi:hypothetical protein